MVGLAERRGIVTIEHLPEGTVGIGGKQVGLGIEDISPHRKLDADLEIHLLRFVGLPLAGLLPRFRILVVLEIVGSNDVIGLVRGHDEGHDLGGTFERQPAVDG